MTYRDDLSNDLTGIPTIKSIPTTISWKIPWLDIFSYAFTMPGNQLRNWKLLKFRSGDGTVSLEELVYGVGRLKGPAKSLDMETWQIQWPRTFFKTASSVSLFALLLFGVIPHWNGLYTSIGCLWYLKCPSYLIGRHSQVPLFPFLLFFFGTIQGLPDGRA